MNTKLRVAVCSSDGRMVDEHFGSTSQFLILEIEESSVHFAEWRMTEPSCQGGSHDGSASARNIALIEDCQLLVAVRAGPPVLAKLAAKGIQVHLTDNSIADTIELLRNQLS